MLFIGRRGEAIVLLSASSWPAWTLITDGHLCFLPYTKQIVVVQVLARVLFAGVNGGCENFRARGEYAYVALP